MDRAVPPVVLRDPAPGTLSVFMSVQMDQGAGEAQLMTTVGLSFYSGAQTAQFAGNERVTCNGADLSLKDRAAVFQLVRAPAAQLAGTTIRCTYTAAGVSATVSLRIPAPPAITSPRASAQVQRGAQTLITYRFDSSAGSIVGIVALAVPASPLPKAIAKLNTPNPLQATIDTSRFAPGPGSLALTMNLTPQIATTGAPFKSVQTGGTALVITPVTWV